MLTFGSQYRLFLSVNEKSEMVSGKRYYRVKCKDTTVYGPLSKERSGLTNCDQFDSIPVTMRERGLQDELDNHSTQHIIQPTYITGPPFYI